MSKVLFSEGGAKCYMKGTRRKRGEGVKEKKMNGRGKGHSTWQRGRGKQHGKNGGRGRGSSDRGLKGTF